MLYLLTFIVIDPIFEQLGRYLFAIIRSLRMVTNYRSYS